MESDICVFNALNPKNRSRVSEHQGGLELIPSELAIDEFHACVLVEAEKRWWEQFAYLLERFDPGDKRIMFTQARCQ